MDRTNKPLVALSLLAAITITIGCSDDIAPEDVPGTYIANYRDFSDTLVIIEAGRRYIHSWTGDDGSVVDTGRWEYDFIEGDRAVVFKNFSFPPDKRLGTSLPRSIWPVKVERSVLGRIRLSIYSDLNLYYEKQ